MEHSTAKEGGNDGEFSSKNGKDPEIEIELENVSRFIEINPSANISENQLKNKLPGEPYYDKTLEMSGEDIVESELSELKSTSSNCSSVKIDNIDTSVVSLKEELVNSDREIETEDGSGEYSSLPMLNGIGGIDFRSFEKMSKITGDGSDSGVEVNGCSAHGVKALLQSGDSCGGGLEDSLSGCTTTPAASCDSSLISCYSTYEDSEDIITGSKTLMLQGDGDGTSEGGSESSSVISKDTRIVRNATSKKPPSIVSRTSGKKKLPAAEAEKSNLSKSRSSSQTATLVNSAKPRTTLSNCQTPLSSSPSSLARSTSHARKEKLASLSSHRLSSGSSTKSSSSSSVSKSVCGSVVGVSKIRSKDSSLSSGSESKKDTPSGSATASIKGKGSKSASIRNKVIGGTDDGRWPSSANKTHSVATRPRGGSVNDGQSRKNISSSVTSSTVMESKASALEKYATLPRRRRCKSPDSPAALEIPLRSHSMSRDPSLNRAASLRKQHHQREGTSVNKSLPPYPRRRSNARTVIYHETSSQTALTAADISKFLACIPVRECGHLAGIETSEQEVQVDRRMEEVESLEFQLRLLTEDHTRLKADSVRQTEELSNRKQQLEEEKAKHMAVREELDCQLQRLLTMLRNAKGDHLEENDSVDTLQGLETYLQSSSSVVIKQQQEISELQTLCQTLKRDLEKSLAAQKTLLQQQQDVEAESVELQEFLQAEKSTLAEALRDAEAEINGQRFQLCQKDSELEQQQEECKHLVRISEQRRQENLALQARLNNLEQRSRELLLQQGAAVSGAAIALSGLSSRLDGLVEQLVVSYNISEKDLEDVIFHNEAYSKSNSSVEASPEKMSTNRPESSFNIQRTPSPKRGASFVSAVISAIKNATAGGLANRLGNQTEETVEAADTEQETLQKVDTETDSSCSAEQEGQDAVSNPRYSTGSITAASLANSESLQNLSQAILNRQQFELSQTDGCDETAAVGIKLLLSLEDCSPAITLVDQIIDVDNLLTKLLKVLRIIQLENDTCVDELHDERIQLAEQVRREQDSRRDAQEEVRKWERIGARLRGEIQDVRLQLQCRVQELEQTRNELQRHRDKIEELTEELNNLSAVCKETEMHLRTHEQEAENVLQQWQQNGQLPSPEILARVITACDEVPMLRKKLSEKEEQLHDIGQKYSMSKQMLTENWHQAATEVRRQYEAIDSALETLQSVQGVVMQCPALAKLQQDLEETNFQSATSLPFTSADLNANAPPPVTFSGTSVALCNPIDYKDLVLEIKK